MHLLRNCDRLYRAIVQLLHRLFAKSEFLQVNESDRTSGQSEEQNRIKYRQKKSFPRKNEGTK